VGRADSDRKSARGDAQWIRFASLAAGAMRTCATPLCNAVQRVQRPVQLSKRPGRATRATPYYKALRAQRGRACNVCATPFDRRPPTRPGAAAPHPSGTNSVLRGPRGPGPKNKSLPPHPPDCARTTSTTL
jgi:hypothetical protein